MNLKTLLLGAVMGGFIAAGTYFFIPTPKNANAGYCDEANIIQTILYCLDGSDLSGETLSTACNG